MPEYKTAKPYTALIPGVIGHTLVRNPSFPFNPEKPSHLWRDNQVSQGAWWAPPTGPRKYSVIARTPEGTPKLTPIPAKNTSYQDAKPFYDTYVSQSIVIAYQTYHFLFPSGVPYLEDLVVDASLVVDINLPPIGQRPTFDYPIELPSDQMLLVKDGDVIAVHYQDFAEANRPKVDGDAQILNAIDSVRRGPMTPAQQVQAIRILVTSGTVPHGLT
jgi:hypothetical protein